MTIQENIINHIEQLTDVRLSYEWKPYDVSTSPLQKLGLLKVDREYMALTIDLYQPGCNQVIDTAKTTPGYVAQDNGSHYRDFIFDVSGLAKHGEYVHETFRKIKAIENEQNQLEQRQNQLREADREIQQLTGIYLSGNSSLPPDDYQESRFLKLGDRW